MEPSEIKDILNRNIEILKYYYIGFSIRHKQDGNLFLLLGGDNDVWNGCKEDFETAEKDIETVCNFITNKKEKGFFSYLWTLRDWVINIRKYIELSGYDYFPIDSEGINEKGKRIWVHTVPSAIYYACGDIVRQITDTAIISGEEIPSHETNGDNDEKQGNEKDLHYYCNIAIEKGYLIKCEDGGYKRTIAITQAQLAYFLKHFLKPGETFPDKKYSEMFHENRLGKAASQLPNNRDGKPRGSEKIDEILSM